MECPIGGILYGKILVGKIGAGKPTEVKKSRGAGKN
jgi:hypothetical protein